MDRNKRIKPRPERFQNCKDLFDLILTCEERVYDQVVEGECMEPDLLFWLHHQHWAGMLMAALGDGDGDRGNPYTL